MSIFFRWPHSHFPPQKCPSEILNEITKGLKFRKLVCGSVRGNKTRDERKSAIDAQGNNTKSAVALRFPWAVRYSNIVLRRN